MEHYSRTIQGAGRKATGTSAGHCRLANETQWVQALLQICGRKLHPYYLRRWLRKYEEDCYALRAGETDCGKGAG